MKAAGILIAFGLLSVVTLGLQQVQLDRVTHVTPERTFSVSEQLVIADVLPGGRMVRSDTAYRRCENGRGDRAHQGEWVYYERDGRRFTWKESCWR